MSPACLPRASTCTLHLNANPRDHSFPGRPAAAQPGPPPSSSCGRLRVRLGAAAGSRGRVWKYSVRMDALEEGDRCLREKSRRSSIFPPVGFTAPAPLLSSTWLFNKLLGAVLGASHFFCNADAPGSGGAWGFTSAEGGTAQPATAHASRPTGNNLRHKVVGSEIAERGAGGTGRWWSVQCRSQSRGSPRRPGPLRQPQHVMAGACSVMAALRRGLPGPSASHPTSTSPPPRSACGAAGGPAAGGLN